MAEQRTTSTQRNHDYQARGFRKAGGLLAVMILSCLVAQNLQQTFDAGWLGIAAPAVVLAAFVIAFFKPLKRSIDTPYFAILSLSPTRSKVLSIQY